MLHLEFRHKKLWRLFFFGGWWWSIPSVLKAYGISGSAIGDHFWQGLGTICGAGSQVGCIYGNLMWQYTVDVKSFNLLENASYFQVGWGWVLYYTHEKFPVLYSTIIKHLLCASYIDFFFIFMFFPSLLFIVIRMLWQFLHMPGCISLQDLLRIVHKVVILAQTELWDSWGLH